MRVLVAAASVAFAASVAHASCAVVESETRLSKQNALVTVMMGGKPAKNQQLLLQIHLFPDGTESELELTTNSRGIIDLNGLKVGRNCLTAFSATGEIRWTSSMCLDVAASRNSAPTKFPLVLTAVPSGPSMDDVLKEKEKLPIEVSVAAFVGTVTDPTGAMIPNANISIFRRGLKTRMEPVKTVTDDEGAFTAPLDSGAYTVVITMPGFKTRFMELEINKDAPKRNVMIDLKIGDSC
jgi:hypothetical protein